MKTKSSTLTAILFLAFFSAFAQSKTEKFEVKGNCGMCETRIEKAAKSVKGVTTAEWDVKTKTISVTFDDSKTTLEKIHEAIAGVGHDTDKKRAKDSVYSRLHSCCKYEREEVEETK
jgi:copper chaperone CopZ